jgi:YebC/PmpR family DNA-binding regulatory protein
MMRLTFDIRALMFDTIYMSGHSHAKTIAHDKGIADQKRGAAFSKMIRLITVAVKDGGSNPDTNARLRMALDMAKGINMPKDNIERAILRASGADEGQVFSDFLFEAYGPGNTALLIEGITDNKNRAFADVKTILNQNGGKLVGEGAIRWMFERKGLVIIKLDDQKPELKNKEALEMETIEAGADDIYWYEDVLEVHTSPESTEAVKKALESKGVKVESFSLAWLAKEEVEGDEKAKEQNDKLMEKLNDNDSVQEVYSNLRD